MVLKFCKKCGVNTNCVRVFKKSSDSPIVDGVFHQRNNKITKYLKRYIPAILFFLIMIFIPALSYLGGKTELFGVSIFLGMIIVALLAGLPFYLIGIVYQYGGSKVRCLTCHNPN